MYNVSQEIIQKKKRALESCDKAVVAEMMEKKDIISILSELSTLESSKGVVHLTFY